MEPASLGYADDALTNLATPWGSLFTWRVFRSPSQLLTARLAWLLVLQDLPAGVTKSTLLTSCLATPPHRLDCLVAPQIYQPYFLLYGLLQDIPESQAGTIRVSAELKILEDGVESFIARILSTLPNTKRTFCFTVAELCLHTGLCKPPFSFQQNPPQAWIHSGCLPGPSK